MKPFPYPKVFSLALVSAAILACSSSTHAATHHVKVFPTGSGNGSSWANACTLQNALNFANSGDEIWVAQGVYLPGYSRNDTFELKSGVAVYGGINPNVGIDTFEERNWTSHPTILTGDIYADDSNLPARTGSDVIGYNIRNVVTANGPITNNTILDGFIITSGDGKGGGLYCDGYGLGNVCSPTLTAVTFSSNVATSSGGAIFVNANSGGLCSPDLSNVAFIDNSAIRVCPLFLA